MEGSWSGGEWVDPGMDCGLRVSGRKRMCGQMDEVRFNGRAGR
jgi:hypothetical protein